jgi:hypothetical protein
VEFESPDPAAANPPGSCLRGGGHRGRPHRTVGVELNARLDTGVILGGRATSVPFHSGPYRSSADNHGQRRSTIDLRGFIPPQVTMSPDLALGAGGRRSAVSPDEESLSPTPTGAYPQSGQVPPSLTAAEAGSILVRL